MKRNVVLSLLAGLALLSLPSVKAWEVSTNVPGTAITTVPFTITTSGNYYLATNLTFTTGVGAAITIAADQVVLDLNGRTLSSNVGTSFNIGIFVFNHKDVTIEQGDIDNFEFGVYFATNSILNNAKNTVDHVKFNNNGIGVYSLSGTSNEVENCKIDGGDVGILFQDDSGSRAQNNILEEQRKTQQFGLGIALLTISSRGVLFDNNLVEKGGNFFGQVMGGTDKYRFESFVGFPVNSPHAGGTNEMADSL
jgi:parallel beta-helix repeat protein